MTLKKRIVYSACWLTLILVLGIGTVFWIVANETSSRRANARASAAGSGFGTMCCIGLAILWLPYAAEIGKRKREQRGRARRKNLKTGRSNKTKTRPKTPANTPPKSKTQTRRKKRPQ